MEYHIRVERTEEPCSCCLTRDLVRITINGETHTRCYRCDGPVKVKTTPEE